MKAILVSILLVSTLVAGPTGATALTPSHSGGTDLAQYASGGYYDAEDLAAIYNENLDAVPGFFRGLLPAGADAEVIVYVFENDSMTVDYYFCVVTLRMGSPHMFSKRERTARSNQCGQWNHSPH